jgi:glycosyltransferase involved in cell wall biosynthesis
MKSIAVVITRMIPGGASQVVRQIIYGGMGRLSVNSDQLTVNSEKHAEKYNFTLFTGFEDLDEQIIDDLKPYCKVIQIPSLVRNISPLKDYSAYRELLCEFRKSKFDVVHTHTSKAGFIGRLAAAKAGVPVIIHSPHGTIYTSDCNIDGVPTFSFGKRLLQIAERYAGSKTTFLTTLSQHEKDICIELGLSNEDNTKIVPNGIDCADFAVREADRDLARKSLGYGSDDIVLLSVGRLSSEKGHAVLLEAFNQVIGKEGEVISEQLTVKSVREKSVNSEDEEFERSTSNIEHRIKNKEGNPTNFKNKNNFLSNDFVKNELKPEIKNLKSEIPNTDHRLSTDRLKLVLVGDGPEMSALMKQASGNRLLVNSGDGKSVNSNQLSVISKEGEVISEQLTVNSEDEEFERSTSNIQHRTSNGEGTVDQKAGSRDQSSEEEHDENFKNKNDFVPNDFIENELKSEIKNQKSEIMTTDHRSPNITFKGHQDNIKPYLAAADIFVLPSFYEGFGIAVIEAMAAGIPVIASDVGGLPEIITDEDNGILFASGNAEDLAEKILFLTNSLKKRNAIGKAGKKRAEDFSTEKMLQGYFDLYG